MSNASRKPSGRAALALAAAAALSCASACARADGVITAVVPSTVGPGDTFEIQGSGLLPDYFLPGHDLAQPADGFVVVTRTPDLVYTHDLTNGTVSNGRSVWALSLADGKVVARIPTWNGTASAYSSSTAAYPDAGGTDWYSPGAFYGFMGGGGGPSGGDEDVYVHVTNRYGTVLSDAFLIHVHAAATRTIDEILPSDVGVDDTIEIRGIGLSNSAEFLLETPRADNTKPLEVLSQTDDRVTLRVPSFFPGDYYIRYDGIRSAQPLHYHEAEPAGVAPAAAGPGEVVTLLGRYFGASPRDVRLGGASATIVSWSHDAVQVVVPASLHDGLAGAAIDGHLLPAAMEITGAPESVARRNRFAVTMEYETNRFAVRRAAYSAGRRELTIVASRVRGWRETVRECLDFLGFYFCDGPRHVVTHQFARRFTLTLPVDLRAASLPLVVRPSDAPASPAKIVYSTWGLPPHRDDFVLTTRGSELSDWSVMLTDGGKGRIAATFSGVVERELVDGRFNVRLRVRR